VTPFAHRAFSVALLYSKIHSRIQSYEKRFKRQTERSSQVVREAKNQGREGFGILQVVDGINKLICMVKNRADQKD
jgi:hypothetical protein